VAEYSINQGHQTQFDKMMALVKLPHYTNPIPRESVAKPLRYTYTRISIDR
jgi:hypothetical protein